MSSNALIQQTNVPHRQTAHTELCLLALYKLTRRAVKINRSALT